jgi:hypothetical protein
MQSRSPQIFLCLVRDCAGLSNFLHETSSGVFGHVAYTFSHCSISLDSLHGYCYTRSLGSLHWLR